MTPPSGTSNYPADAVHDLVEWYRERLAAADAENERLRASLAEALDEWESCSGYADLSRYSNLRRMAERYGVKQWTEEAFALLDENERLRAAAQAVVDTRFGPEVSTVPSRVAIAIVALRNALGADNADQEGAP